MPRVAGTTLIWSTRILKQKTKTHQHLGATETKGSEITTYF